MSTPAPSDLDKKYLLLSACFPGIQTRKLTHKRYLEKKEEMRRLVKQGLSRKSSLPELAAPSTLPKLPHQRLGDDPSDRSFLSLHSRKLNQSIDLLTPSPSCTSPSKQLTLWTRKISDVQKQLKGFDQVRMNLRKTL